MKIEAVPARVAQGVGDIQVLLHAGQAVQEEGGRARRIAGRQIKATQEFLALRVKDSVAQTRRKCHVPVLLRRYENRRRTVPGAACAPPPARRH